MKDGAVTRGTNEAAAADSPRLGFGKAAALGAGAGSSHDSGGCPLILWSPSCGSEALSLLMQRAMELAVLAAGSTVTSAIGGFLD
jgi:hypothetical protein